MLAFKLDEAYQFTMELAREAGAILRERFGTALTVEQKGPADLVTEADRLSEAHILRRIRERYPDHDILAEEAGLQARSGAFRWIIDPLDGTTNFARSLPLFGVSIALEVEGELALGAIYDPMGEELFSAVKGRGAWLNGEPIRVSTVERLEDGLFAMAFPSALRRTPMAQKSLAQFAVFSQRSLGVRRLGTAVLELAYVAAGRLDGYWGLELNAWDMAAGVLVVQEAGGQVSGLDGSPFRLDGRQILASNGRLHPTMVHRLAEAGARDGAALPGQEEGRP